MPSPLHTFFRRDVNDPIMVSRKRRGGVEWKARRVMDLGNENGVSVERRESLLRVRRQLSAGSESRAYM